MVKRKRDRSDFHLPIPHRGEVRAPVSDRKNNDVISKLANGALRGGGRRAKGNHFPLIVLWDMDNVKPANSLFSKPTEFHNFLELHFKNEGFSGKIAQFHAFGWPEFFTQTVGFKSEERSEYPITYHENDKKKRKQKNVTDEAMADHLRTMLDDVTFDGKYNIVALTGDEFCLGVLVEARQKWCGALIIIATNPGRCSDLYTNSPNVDLIRYWNPPDRASGLENLRGCRSHWAQRQKWKRDRKAQRKKEAAAAERKREREAAAERKRESARKRKREAARKRKRERKDAAERERERKAAEEREREREAAAEREREAAAERKQVGKQRRRKAARDRRKKAAQVVQ